MLDSLKASIQGSLLGGSVEDLAVQIGILLAGGLLSTAVWLLWGRYIGNVLQGPPAVDLRGLSLRASKRLVFPVTLGLVALMGHAILGSIGRSTGLLDVAVPLLAALVAIRLMIFLLRVGGGGEHRLTFVEYLISTWIWVLLILYLAGWLPPVEHALDRVALQLGQARISVLALFKFLIAASVLLLFFLWISRLIEARIQRHFSVDPALGSGVAKVVRYVLVLMAFLVAVDSAGVDLTSLTVLGGAIGVGLGFGLQRVASNLVSGYLLLFDRSIRPGDVISVGDSYGWVQKLAARYIVVRDRNGVDTLIPNERLIANEVINWSYGDRNVRLKLPAQISYADDPVLAMSLMEQAALVSPRVSPDPPPGCRLMGFGDNGIELELRVWISDPENGVNNVRSDINLAIWTSFKEHGITIPYPQRDVHITNADSESDDKTGGA